MGFTHFGVVECVGNTLTSYFVAEVGMNIFCSRERLTKGSCNSYVCHLRLSCIFTYSHLHTHTHTHLYIFLYLFLKLTSSHLHSHLHTHIFTYSHILSLFSFLSPFSLSFLSPFSLSRLLYLSLFRPRVVPARSHETSTLSHEMRADAQKLRSNCDFTCAGLVPEQPFRTK